MGSVHAYGAACFFVFGLIYWVYVDSLYMLVSNLLFGAACSLNWLAHRRFDRSALFTVTFLLFVYVGLVNVAVHLGADDTPMAFWGLSVLVAAAFMHKTRGLVVWIVASLAFLPLCLLLKRGPLSHRVIALDHGQVLLLYVATYVGLALFLAYTYFLFRGRIDRSVRELRAAREELEERVLERTSELAQVNEQIHGSETLLRAIVENIPDMIFVKDAENLRFVRFNKAGEKILGYQRDELLGKNDYDFFPKAEADGFTRKDREVLRSGTLTEIPSERIETKHGPRTLRTKKLPILGEDGVPQYLLGIAEDITERLQLEEERRRLEAHLQHSQKVESLGVLTGGIAHDFNNLLVGINGNLELAIGQAEEGTVRSHLESARTASRRAAELVRQMLAYAGKGRRSQELIDLNALATEMTELLNVSVPKKIRLTFDLAPSLPNIEGDPTQIRQVVMNLITNAAQAIGQEVGEITVRSVVAGPLMVAQGRQRFGLSMATYVQLEVQDTGLGIDAQVASRIFEPFFTTKTTGSGLGLAAVQGIVRDHGGGVLVESEVGLGAKFTVLLPASEKAAEVVIEKPADTLWKGSGTVLVIEDEEAVRNVVQQVLRIQGFDVLVAQDGPQGIGLFEARHAEIVCVLLDSRMPHMDGEDVFYALQKIRQDVPVILCSGFAESELTSRLRKHGLADFIQKPYELPVLNESLRRAIGARRTPSPSGVGD